MAYTEDSAADAPRNVKRPLSHAGPMDEDEFQEHVKALTSDAELYVDTQLSPYRAEATSYYNGEPLGNEEDGRSQIVVTELADAIRGAMPSLMRVFFGPVRVVEYQPRKPQDVEAAAQATDYANYIISEENDGFTHAHSVFKDGLMKKLGVFCWYWDDTTTKKAYSLKNISQSDLELLAQDESIEITRVTDSDYTPPESPSGDNAQMSPNGATAPEKYFDVELTKTDRDGCVRVEAVPSEEFLVSRNAKSMESALLVGRRFVKTRGELIALGVDEKIIDEFGGADPEAIKNNPEYIERNQLAGLKSGSDEQPESGPSNDEFDYYELYPLVDYDGDGVSELRRVTALGPSYHVLTNIAYDCRPFSGFCPDPEPHALLGGSWHDRLRDMQRVSSMLLRCTFDSLALSIYPRTAYVEGQANYNDIVNNEIGAPIRMTQQGAVEPFKHEFTGAQALPVMDKVSEIIERRTGIAKGATGLDADALQSTEKEAAAAAVQSAKDQLELLCRFFAEQALKPMFRGILKLLVQYQPKSRMVKLRGNWVNVDPAAWDADMMASVNIALGLDAKERKLGILGSILAKQEQYYQQLGPSNPLVSLGQIANTLNKIVEMSGEADASQYFKPLPLGFDMPPAQPQQSPEQMLAQAQIQIEQMKTQRTLAIKEAELELKRNQQALDTDLANKKLADDYALRLLAIDAQFKTSYSEQQLEAIASAQERWLGAQSQAHDQALAQEQQAHEQELAAQQQQHDQQMAQQQQAAEQQAAAQQAAQGATQ